MPRKTPSLRLHKATGQGYVELNGRRIYLGKYELPETEERYHATISEWLANGRKLPVEAAVESVARAQFVSDPAVGAASIRAYGARLDGAEQHFSDF